MSEAIRIHNVWVNSSGTMEHSYADFHPDRRLDEAISTAIQHHPSWTSMVITITNPSPILKQQA